MARTTLPLSLRTVLVLFPVRPPVLTRLRTLFPTVHYYPAKRFWTSMTPSEEAADLRAFQVIPRTHLEQTDTVFCLALPRGLESREQVPNLKWIQLMSAGSDNALRHPLLRSWQRSQPGAELLISGASGSHGIAMSQHVFLLALALYHRLPRNIITAAIEQRPLIREELPHDGLFIPELRGKTVGILGYGHVGREIARVAKAGWGMVVLACTSTGQAKPESGLPHLPRHALIINVGRGDAICNSDLLSTLESGAIAGAGLDVTDPEPLEPGHPFFGREDVIVTPHVSGGTEKYVERATDVLEVNLERLRRGEDLVNRVEFG